MVFIFWILPIIFDDRKIKIWFWAFLWGPNSKIGPKTKITGNRRLFLASIFGVAESLIKSLHRAGSWRGSALAGPLSGDERCLSWRWRRRAPRGTSPERLAQVCHNAAAGGALRRLLFGREELDNIDDGRVKYSERLAQAAALTMPSQRRVACWPMKTRSSRTSTASTRRFSSREDGRRESLLHHLGICESLLPRFTRSHRLHGFRSGRSF